MGAPPLTDGSNELGDADFARVRRFLKARSGIDLSEAKRSLVVGRLLGRVRRRGLSPFTELLDEAEAEEGAAQALVNALTTNVTAFFREAHHFELLAQELQNRRAGPLRVWSAACSTGEEPWSMAGVLLTAGRPLEGLSIMATDIDSEVLATAKAGVYPAERIDPVPAAVRGALLQRGTGSNEGLVRVTAAARALVSFGQLNLLEPWPRMQPFDVIFCRNVLIYFDGPTRAAVVTRLGGQLAPGGLLCLGHSESLMGSTPEWHACGKTSFRRRVVAAGKAA